MPDEEKSAEELAEEAAAVTAEEQKQEGSQEEGADGEQKEEPAKVEPASTEKLSAAVDKLSELLKPSNKTPEQIEAEVKKVETESGFSRTQLGWMAGQMRQSAITSNLSLHQEVGTLRAEKALGTYAPKLKEQVVEAMKRLPAETQANPEAWEQMAYMLKGKHMGGETQSSGGEKKNMPGLTNTTTSGGGRSKGKQYNEDEKVIISQYFAGNSEEYEKNKGKTLRSVIPDKSTTGNAADKELQRLTGGVYS